MPFPGSVERGTIYGSTDAVMVGADIFGLASRVGSGERLTGADRALLEDASRSLVESIGEYPPLAQPYYDLLLQIAQVALA